MSKTKEYRDFKKGFLIGIPLKVTSTMEITQETDISRLH